MSGYVLDEFALTAGFTTDGEEQHRRELSRLLIAAIDRGPAIWVPALCLSAAAVRRPTMAGHLADLVVGGPVGAIDIIGLGRTAEIAQLRAEHPGLEWPALHAISTASAGRLPVVTIDPARYGGAAVEVVHL